MSAIKILPNLFWVGAIDWNIRHFHGYTYQTPHGTTYNAYLILDEKVTLVDAVYGPFAPDLINNIRQIISPEKIDYIVVNHVEMDHSGALPEIMKLCPQAKLFGTAKCKEGLEKHYYGNWNFQIVRTGDKLNLGKRNLTFIEAPMIHWPDSMFTYIDEDEVLMSNDAFGQHYASAERYADELGNELLREESKKYYANILWPFGNLILKKIEEIKKLNLPLKMIAPAHGLIWRKDIPQVVGDYERWAKNECESKVTIVYETMHGSTKKIAGKMAEGIAETGVAVKFFDITNSDPSEVIQEMLESKGFLIGSSTHDNDLLPNMAGFLTLLKGLKPKNRIGAAFGSFGWAGGATKTIENFLKDSGMEIALPSFNIKYVPSAEELNQCFEFGKNFVKKGGMIG